MADDVDPGDKGGELLPGLNAVPGIARVAAGAWYRSAVWGVAATVGAAQRLGDAATSAEGAAHLLDEVRAETIDGVRKVLGFAGEAAPDGAVSDAVDSVKPSRKPAGEHPRERRAERARSLRERGGELLDRAADVEGARDPVHPGFARIIDQLAPDEARILKLLINEGPRGIIYVNKAAPFGIGAREIARRLSMIGHEAGCLHIGLVPAYLDNLVSHGLVAIRRDALVDEMPYQVIEAQPEVLEAIESASGTVFRGHITRRSVHLTDFGRTFCQVCFPPEHLTGEFDAIDVSGEGLVEVAKVAPPEPDVD